MEFFHIKEGLLGSILALLISLPSDQATAQTYPVDCSILLCLAGGWPSASPCPKARSEFMRRATPWPIEPPLQVWRCPLQRVPLNTYGLANTPMISGQPRIPAHGLSHGDTGTSPTASQTHLSIRGPEFGFLGAIRVFHLAYLLQRERENGRGCQREFSLKVGTYDEDGVYRWTEGAPLASLPTGFSGAEHYGQGCSDIFIRAVFVEWRDYEGNYGFEQVNY